MNLEEVFGFKTDFFEPNLYRVDKLYTGLLEMLNLQPIGNRKRDGLENTKVFIGFIAKEGQ